MNLNKVMFAGRLTRDPQVRYLPSNSAICEFTVASNRKYKSRDGKDVDDTCFVDCVAYAEKGNQISTHFKKGKPILIEGRLKYESWEKDGVKRSKLVLVVETWHFVGAPASGQALPAGDESMAMPRHDAEDRGGGSRPESGEPSFSDDDVPFHHNLPARTV